MKLQNISKGMILSLIAAGALTSCSEDMMDSINNDRNNTTSMPARFILTDVMTSSAFSNTGGDISTYVSAYIEHEAGCFNQTLRAEMRNGEPSSSATFNNVWGNVYSTLMNSKDAISKADAEMNYVSKGIAQILAAYNLALTTDMWGDTPWSESGD